MLQAGRSVVRFPMRSLDFSIVFARLNTGIVGSNPARGMDVCLRLFYVCVVLCR
jgi:hypothetical protein